MKKLSLIFAFVLLCTSLLMGCSGEPAKEITTAPTENAAGTVSDETASIETQTNSETVPAKTQTTTETAEDRNESAHMLDGKKVIFIGNSYTYYGKTVLEKSQKILHQSPRNNDKGYFYQLCKANGAEVSVTNWTFGGHSFDSLFETCVANRGCDGVDHKKYLVDRNYDYVIMQEGSVSAEAPDIVGKVEAIMNLFKEVNPNTKFVFLVQSQAHIQGYKWRPNLKELEAKGVIIVDWGAVVYDVMEGNVAVPGAKQTYNKNSFIVCKSAKDGYHPNMLAGYITTLMTYCAITGESPVGQDYSFCTNSEINAAFHVPIFVNTLYTYKNATTNFPDVFESPSDMTGLQTLVGKYLNEKAYRNY
ncbi:MAG: hypothetical protein IKD18_06950 [Clostridia bacterium]|nr:hypothetical protein [Clostridia bacterium]